MSKQRALELCGDSDRKVSQYTRTPDIGPLARGVQDLFDAVRELAKDEPEDPRYKQAFDNCDKVREYLDLRVVELEKQVDDLTVELAKAKAELDNQKYRACEH